MLRDLEHNGKVLSLDVSICLKKRLPRGIWAPAVSLGCGSYRDEQIFRALIPAIVTETPWCISTVPLVKGDGAMKHGSRKSPGIHRRDPQGRRISMVGVISTSMQEMHRRIRIYVISEVQWTDTLRAGMFPVARNPLDF